VSQLNDKSDYSIAKAIGVNPYMTKPYLSACRNYSFAKLFFIISLFREYDVKSKGVDVSPMTTEGDLLKELIFRIMY
jgi:DNA polymerase-3 subunit delta